MWVICGGGGLASYTAATVRSVRGDATARSVTIKTAGGPEREQAYGQILVAAGRRALTTGLNLDVIGVKTGGRGEIVPHESRGTANPRIWAAGGGPRGPPFVYHAAAHGAPPAPNAPHHAR